VSGVVRFKRDSMEKMGAEKELEWFFAYARAALHRESVGMLPSYGR
jgi:hypothetical protein